MLINLGKIEKFGICRFKIKFHSRVILK